MRTLLASLFFVALPAHAALNVLACEPEWEALVKEIGGDKVRRCRTRIASRRARA
jgi:zinc/manganese transport system substrate-binding protein